MAKLDYAKAVAILEGARTVAICGHVNPDGDCLGSILALAAALRSRGVEVAALLADQERPALYDFLEGYETLTPAGAYHGYPDVFVAVDVPSAERMGQGYDVFRRCRRTIMIDHHENPADFATANYSDPHCAAAGILIWDLIDQMGIQRTPAIATCCYTALVTDTGRFQFQNTDAVALRAAAAMTTAGASPSFISSKVYQRKSLASLQLESLVVQRAGFLCQGRAVISWIDMDDIKKLGASKDDCENLIDVIRQLNGVEVAAILRGQKDCVRGSIRSKTNRDVAHIARKLGGGGHSAAAGFSYFGDMNDAIKTVASLIIEDFDGEEAVERWLKRQKRGGRKPARS